MGVWVYGCMGAGMGLCECVCVGVRALESARLPLYSHTGREAWGLDRSHHLHNSTSVLHSLVTMF